VDSDTLRLSRQIISRMHQRSVLIQATPPQLLPKGNAACTLIKSLVVTAITASAVLLTPAVHAQTITASLGDLILGFRAVGGTGAGVNLEVDLGSVSNFYNGASSMLALSQLVTQDLIDTYGANWGTRTDLFWAAAATDGNAQADPNGKPASTLWATGVPGDAAPIEGTSGLQSPAATKIFGLYNGSLGSLDGATSTSNSSAAAVIQNTLAGSWSVQETSGNSFGFFNPKIDGQVSNVGALNLYELQPTTTFPRPAGTLLGTLILTQNGLSFQAGAGIAPPAAAFSGSPTNGEAPLMVTFVNSSTGTITNQAWDFGDGGTDNTTSPSHTYTNAGIYTVTLTVYGPGGSNTLKQLGYVVIGSGTGAPVAAFSGSPTNGVAPLMVTFVNSSTGTITNQAWDFGDGGTDNTTSPSHTYTNAGIYTVTLTVYGPGGSNTLTQAGYVVVGSGTGAPVAVFSGSPTNGVAPLTVNFINNSTGTITNQAWDFGDGATSNAASPSHTYANAGAYTVTLAVYGPGGSNTLTQAGYVMVGTAPPVAAFSGGPTNGVAPLTVSFVDNSTGAVISRAWSFGDGGMSSATSPSHTYTNAGMFTVSLSVVGPGGSNTLNRVGLITITSTNVPPDTTPPTLAIVSPTDYQTFTNAGLVVMGTANDASGIQSVAVNGAPASLLGTNWFINVTLAQGTNGIIVIATDSSPAMNTATQVVHAVLSAPGTTTNRAPVIVSAPAVMNALLCLSNACVVVAGDTNIFSVGATDPNGLPLNYTWDFGDGATTVPSPINIAKHVYTNCGPYNVSVTVADGVASTNASLTVSVPCALNVSQLKLQAKFTKTGSDGCTIKGTLSDLPEGFSITNAAVSLDVGGATVDIQLNAKGSGANKNGNIKFSRNKKTGVWTFTSKLKGDLKGSWATYGITSGTVIDGAVTFPVLLVLHSDTVETFNAELPLTYNNSSGTSGTAILIPAPVR